jgi:hypothetical protein
MSRNYFLIYYLNILTTIYEAYIKTSTAMGVVPSIHIENETPFPLSVALMIVALSSAIFHFARSACKKER